MVENCKAYHADTDRTYVFNNNDYAGNIRTVKKKTTETVTTKIRTVQTGTGAEQTLETETVQKKSCKIETTEYNGPEADMFAYHDVKRKGSTKDKTEDSTKGRNVQKAKSKGKTDKGRKKGKKLLKKIARNIKKWTGNTVRIIVVTAILTIIFEKVRFLQGMGKWSAGIISSLEVAKGIVFCIDKFVSVITGMSILGFIQEHEESFIVEILKFFWQIFVLMYSKVCRLLCKLLRRKHCPKLKLQHGLIAVVVLFMACAGSEQRVCLHAAEAITKFFQNDVESGCAKLVNEHGAMGISAIYSKTTSEEKVNNNLEDGQIEEETDAFMEKESTGRFDNEAELKAKDIIVTEEDRNREEELPISHYNDIFHLEGEFTVEDWSDQDAINAIVLQMMMDENAQQKENKFDRDEMGDGNELADKDADGVGGEGVDVGNDIGNDGDNDVGNDIGNDSDKEGTDILSALRGKVYMASENEKKEHTFSKRIEMKETREDAYDSYPKSSLAKLISNDNHALALALVLNGGKKRTEMYYYGESILWGREYIGFADVSADLLKEKLNWIAERYKDIRSICSESDPEYEYAEKLMMAYQYAAENFQYFQ